MVAPDGSKPAWAAYDFSTTVSPICTKPDAPGITKLDITPGCPTSSGMTTEISSSLPFTLTKGTIQSVDMACTAVPYTNLNLCENLPPPPTMRSDGTGFYTYHLEGVGGDGKPFAFDQEANAPVCPSGSEIPNFTIAAGCQVGAPIATKITFTPPSLEILVVGDALSCTLTAPGELDCSGGTPDPVTGNLIYKFEFSADGGDTWNLATIFLALPEGCTKPPTSEVPKFLLVPSCNPKGSGFQVSVEFVPTDITVTGVYDAFLNPLTCTTYIPGEMVCTDTAGT